MKKRIIISLVLLSSFYPKSPPKIHKKKVQKTKQNKTRDPQREEGGKKRF